MSGHWPRELIAWILSDLNHRGNSGNKEIIPGAEKYPALPMSSLLSSYLTSSYSLDPQWLLPVGIPYPSWPSWHAGQSSGHSFKCGFLINRETPVRQEGVQVRILYVIVIYRLLGMSTSTEMAWSKIPFLRKSLTTQGGLLWLHSIFCVFFSQESGTWKTPFPENTLTQKNIWEGWWWLREMSAKKN